MSTSNSEKPFEGYTGRQEQGEKTIKGIITADIIGIEAGGIVFKQGKAKVFNVLEAILSSDSPDNGFKEFPKLRAYKRITEGILDTIARDVKEYVVAILGEDFQLDVETNAQAVLSGEKRAAAEAEYRELEEKLR